MQQKGFEFEETLSTPQLTSGNPMLKGNMQSHPVKLENFMYFRIDRSLSLEIILRKHMYFKVEEKKFQK